MRSVIHGFWMAMVFFMFHATFACQPRGAMDASFDRHPSHANVPPAACDRDDARACYPPWEDGPLPPEAEDHGALKSGTRPTPSSVHASSTMLPKHGTDSEENDKEYTTDLVMSTSCPDDFDPLAVSVAGDDDCHALYATPAMQDDGDFYEVSAFVQWISWDPDRVQVTCTGSPKCRSVFVQTSEDLFDVGGDKEPTTIVSACVTNDCTASSESCPPVVCTSVVVAAVISLQGDWILSGITLDPATTLTLMQTGRRLVDSSHTLEGSIDASNVSFELGDYAYQGQILPDRSHLQGTVIDLINDIPIGTWSAVRAP